jgi:hypothetical protein
MTPPIRRKYDTAQHQTQDIFSIKGLSGTRRERVEAAVVAGGEHARGPHEGWITVDGTVRRTAAVPMRYFQDFRYHSSDAHNSRM